MFRGRAQTGLAILACFLFSITANCAFVDPEILDACPGYDAVNIAASDGALTADLHLRGAKCNVFGQDVTTLRLQVTYETGMFTLLSCCKLLPNVRVIQTPGFMSK